MARSRSRGWRRLERWQVLLAAAIAAVASIIVALIGVPHGGSTGVSTTPPSVSPGVSAATPSGSGSLPKISVVITSLSEQSVPPPPGRLYVWSGTVLNQPTGSSIYIIAKRPGAPQTPSQSSPAWLVSPPASVLKNGTWTLMWVIPKPPSAVQWIAVIWIQTIAPCPSPGCGLNNLGPNDPGVKATATYPP